MGPISAGANTNGVFVIPTDEEVFLCAIVGAKEDMAGDFVANAATLPEAWEGKFKPHLWDIEGYVDALIAHPDTFTMTSREDALSKYAAEGVSHIALLEGPVVPEGSHPVKWGKKVVTGISLLVTYSADRNAYRMIHCESCAYVMVKWLEMMQGVWGNADGQEAGGSRPLN